MQLDPSALFKIPCLSRLSLLGIMFYGKIRQNKVIYNLISLQLILVCALSLFKLLKRQQNILVSWISDHMCDNFKRVRFPNYLIACPIGSLIQLLSHTSQLCIKSIENAYNTLWLSLMMPISILYLTLTYKRSLRTLIDAPWRRSPCSENSCEMQQVLILKSAHVSRGMVVGLAKELAGGKAWKRKERGVLPKKPRYFSTALFFTYYYSGTGWARRRFVIIFCLQGKNCKDYNLQNISWECWL